MSHNLDVEGIVEKLVLLQHFAAGSRGYCVSRRPASQFDDGYEEFDDYWGWTKGIVCSYTLECAIKFRVLLDSVTGTTARRQLSDADVRARQGLQVGQVTKGDFELTLRELSNKIIHATRVVPEWKASRASGARFKFWSGTLLLTGARSGRRWHLQLYVFHWARAMQLFLSDSEAREALRYVGQDWFPSESAP